MDPALLILSLRISFAVGREIYQFLFLISLQSKLLFCAQHTYIKGRNNGPYRFVAVTFRREQSIHKQIVIKYKFWQHFKEKTFSYRMIYRLFEKVHSLPSFEFFNWLFLNFSVKIHLNINKYGKNQLLHMIYISFGS